jgi:cellulose synthase operon protein C
LAAETYKTALRAYISVLPSAADPQAAVGKAIRLMDDMKAAVPADKLIGIYVGLAHDLEEQMKLASPQARQSLSRGFEAFLVRIRESATEFGVLNWVAATFSSMASSFWDESQKLTPDAKKYYEEAAATYRTILEKSTFSDPRQKAQVQLQYALTQRRLNGFLEAKRLYLEILRPNPLTVNVQVEAARMYEEWAAFPGKDALYEKAIRGAEPEAQQGTNVIWGWAHLASVLARHPKFRDPFHEARYHLALCRYRWARAQQTKPEQDTLFEKAKQDILRTQELFGSGPEWDAWKPRYDALLKNIQKDLGQEPAGLPTRAVAKAALPSRDTKSP